MPADPPSDPTPDRGSPRPGPGTWGWLKEQARYESRRITYLGGGLAGLIVLGTGDVGFDEVQWLRAAFVVTVLLAGAGLGLAWEKSIRLVAEIDRDHGQELHEQTTEILPWPLRRNMRVAVLMLVLAAAIVLVASVWSAAVSPPAPPGQR
jgi:hypothetical protein